MKTATPRTAPIASDPQSWPQLSDDAWVALHVPRFARVQPHYQAYEEFLKAALKAACRKLAPLAIVEARAKALASFAEKILRKRAVYIDPTDPLPPDPLVRLTDLCGGRVIVQTSAQVKAVCRFIEAAFDIDWANSEDVSQRLKPQEFGYRSVHYIVSVNPAKLAAAGIAMPVPPVLLGFDARTDRHAAGRPLKAEIQVRTLLEHAWSDIGHDLAYKGEYQVPDRLKRNFAGIAAVLEGADREFSRLVAALDEFKTNTGAYLAPAEVAQEIDRLRLVQQHDPGNLALALKIARLAMAAGRHELVCDLLAPWGENPPPAVQRTLGLALTEIYWEKPRCPEYRDARKYLEAAVAAEPSAELLCALAENWANAGEDESARLCFRRGLALDNTEPLTLCHYLEFEVAHQSSDAAVRMAEPMILQAIERCHRQIEARANVPVAWSCLAIFHLLLGDAPERRPHAFAALDALAHTIQLCRGEAARREGSGSARPCVAGSALLRTRAALRRLRSIRKLLPAFDWLERAALLGLAVRGGDDVMRAELGELASWRDGAPFIDDHTPCVWLSGGCSPEVQAAIDVLRPQLLRAGAGLSFNLLSGGTTSGISGLAGELARRSKGAIHAYGYLPRTLPRNVREDTRGYEKRIELPGTDFSPLGPLQGWTDLVAAGVDLARVRLVAFAGGDISHAECALALALGARVAVIAAPGLPPRRQFNDSAWNDVPGLVRLPLDAMTLRAFLVVETATIDAEGRARLEPAARLAHEAYAQSARPKDPAFARWEELSEDLKNSNFHQVAYAVNILATAGLAVRRRTDAKAAPFNLVKELGAEGVRRLAEMEHGRWNVERLLRGWRYADKKDVARRLSPYLVPWKDLSPEIQQYDVDAIVNLSAKLAKVGLGIYRLQKG